ncbi:mitochondrial potassium channel isoform X1 [Augochlora pura]
MSAKLQSLLKGISSKVNKYLLIDKGKTINNASEKVQAKLSNMQNTITAKYGVIAKQVNSDIMFMQNLSVAKLEPSPLPKKVAKWWQWYQQLMGLDTVEMAKHQVIVAQDKLFKCQDERRNLNRHAKIINDKLKDLYSDLINTKRDDPRYVQLTIIENKHLQDQATITSELDLLDKEEKDHFTQLATAIKEYHDTQTMYAQKYKYVSIIVSAAVAIISLIGSKIYNNQKIKNIVDAINTGLESIESNMNTKLRIINDNIELHNKVENLEPDRPSQNGWALHTALLGLGFIITYILFVRN